MSEDLLQRLHDSLESMAPLASPEKLGSRFALGSGLELAIDSLRLHLSNPDEARSADQMVMVDLLTQIDSDDPERATLEVMGVGSAPIPGDEAGELAGAAVELVRQSREPGSLWRMWEERDDVALELLAWHCVARLRLATAGLAPPVKRLPV